MPSIPDTHSQARDRGPENLLQDLAGDDHPVDLVGAFVDLGDLQKARSRPGFAPVGGAAGAQLAQNPFCSMPPPADACRPVPELIARIEQRRTGLAMTETTHLTVPAHLLSCTQLPVGSPARFSWTLDDVAAALQISVRHLKTIRDEDPSFPAPRLLGTVPRWAPASIAGWLAGEPGASSSATDDVDAAAGPAPAPAGASRRRKPPAGRPAAKAAAQSASSTGPVWHV